MRYMQERYSVNIMVFGGLCLIILLLSGCGTQLTAKGNSDPLEMNFWAPNLLYLNSSKCQRLYVEIDTVQGSEPNTETIESLREFLKQYCSMNHCLHYVPAMACFLMERSARGVRIAGRKVTKRQQMRRVRHEEETTSLALEGH